MTKTAIQLERIGHACLRVRNLRRSADFYESLLGLEPIQCNPPSMVSWICAPPDENPPRLSLILTQGLPPGTEISGLDHLSFVVTTNDDVDKAFAQATEIGARVTRPRIYAGHYQIFAFDPDGYKIEICSSSNKKMKKSRSR